jgi:hypothetical protein
MKLKTTLTLTSAALLAAPAFGGGHMADTMTIVSWAEPIRHPNKTPITTPTWRRQASRS